MSSYLIISVAKHKLYVQVMVYNKRNIMRKHIHRLGLLSFLLAFIIAAGPTALAFPSQANSHAQAADVGSPTRQARLAEAQLKVCQKRQKTITNIMNRIADRGQKHLKLFDTIASRVEAFYVKKGKTLANYDTLIADVNAKQAAAQVAVDTVKSDAAGFSCEGTNPRGLVSSFKTSLKSEVAALHAYRKAIRNLTVGVKSVQSTSVPEQTDNGGNQ